MIKKKKSFGSLLAVFDSYGIFTCVYHTCPPKPLIGSRDTEDRPSHDFLPRHLVHDQTIGTIRPQASTNNSCTIHQLLWWGTVGGTTGLIKEIKERMSQ
jgi:hypothetical protein